MEVLSSEVLRAMRDTLRNARNAALPRDSTFNTSYTTFSFLLSGRLSLGQFFRALAFLLLQIYNHAFAIQYNNITGTMEVCCILISQLYFVKYYLFMIYNSCRINRPQILVLHLLLHNHSFVYSLSHSPWTYA